MRRFSLALPKVNPIPLLSAQEANHDGLGICTQQIPQTWSGVTKAGESGRYHKCQMRCYILNL